mmetsp:Transcript_13315/g.22618  ORF Transcript_13315/g.22618 Transcript_13315/m.22618 type:complete len:246 (-) Transcript_13315:748-1485(-)
MLGNIEEPWPVVMQEANASEGNLTTNQTGFGRPFTGNRTNKFDFPFQNHSLYEDARMIVTSFLRGLDSDYYSPNISVCIGNLLNLFQYDFELMVIKYMYADAKGTIMNTTLFLRNVSDVSYVCIDAAENIFVFSQYKYELFGSSGSNLVLGFIQNLLGSILTIDNLFNRVIQAYEKNETQTMYLFIGRITRMVIDFEPVILEEAASPLADLSAPALPEAVSPSRNRKAPSPTVWQSAEETTEEET